MNYNYRSAAGPPDQFDVNSAAQFHLLTSLGLREYHSVLDVGCGPLALGRLLIPYLKPGRYFGIESDQRNIEDGVRFELGHDLAIMRRPQFLAAADFRVREFGVKFDYAMAHAIFTCLPAAQIQACLREVAACLQPEGLLISSWAIVHKAEPQEEMEYTVSRIREMANEAGLKIKVLDWPHPSGHTWAVLHLPGCRKVSQDPSFDGPPARLSSIEIASDQRAGYVERAEEAGDYVLIGGWALDPRALRPASQLLFADLEGNILAAGRVDRPRPDIAHLHGPQAMQSGFRVLIHKSVLGDLSGLSCYAFSSADKIGYYLPGALPAVILS